VARLARRYDLRWMGFETALDCLPALRRFAAGAIADVEELRRLPQCDAVLAGDTLEHFQDPAEVLRRAHAALAPGGLLLLSVPNVAHLYVRLNLLWGRFPYADRGILDRTHRHFFTSRLLRSMVETAGFTVERFAVSTVPLALVWPRLPAFLLGGLSAVLTGATRLLPRLLGYQLLLVARRR
jgi:SAM-dependent methyltransferase